MGNGVIKALFSFKLWSGKWDSTKPPPLPPIPNGDCQMYHSGVCHSKCMRLYTAWCGGGGGGGGGRLWGLIIFTKLRGQNFILKVNPFVFFSSFYFILLYFLTPEKWIYPWARNVSPVALIVYAAAKFAHSRLPSLSSHSKVTIGLSLALSLSPWTNKYVRGVVYNGRQQLVHIAESREFKRLLQADAFVPAVDHTHFPQFNVFVCVCVWKMRARLFMCVCARFHERGAHDDERIALHPRPADDDESDPPRTKRCPDNQPAFAFRVYSIHTGATAARTQ